MIFFISDFNNILGGNGPTQGKISSAISDNFLAQIREAKTPVSGDLNIKGANQRVFNQASYKSITEDFSPGPTAQKEAQKLIADITEDEFIDNFTENKLSQISSPNKFSRLSRMYSNKKNQSKTFHSDFEEFSEYSESKLASNIQKNTVQPSSNTQNAIASNPNLFTETQKKIELSHPKMAEEKGKQPAPSPPQKPKPNTFSDKTVKPVFIEPRKLITAPDDVLKQNNHIFISNATNTHNLNEAQQKALANTYAEFDKLKAKYETALAERQIFEQRNFELEKQNNVFFIELSNYQTQCDSQKMKLEELMTNIKSLNEQLKAKNDLIRNRNKLVSTLETKESVNEKVRHLEIENDVLKIKLEETEVILESYKTQNQRIESKLESQIGEIMAANHLQKRVANLEAILEQKNKLLNDFERLGQLSDPKDAESKENITHEIIIYGYLKENERLIEELKQTKARLAKAETDKSNNKVCAIGEADLREKDDKMPGWAERRMSWRICESRSSNRLKLRTSRNPKVRRKKWKDCCVKTTN